MLGRWASAVLGRSNKEDAAASSTAVSSNEPRAHEGIDEEECLFEASVYKIDGSNVQLVRPKLQLSLTDTSLNLLADASADEVELSWPYEKILSIRQFKPSTAQFLFQKSRDEIEEYGLHFASADHALTFRTELLVSLSTTTESICTGVVSGSIFHTRRKEYVPWFEEQKLVIGRRSSDGLAILTIWKQDEGENEIFFQTELIRDVQLWCTPDSKTFTLWGPYIQQTDSADKSLVRTLFQFVVNSCDDMDIAEVFEVLQRLNGYEEKLIESNETFEMGDEEEKDYDEQMEWDESDGNASGDERQKDDYKEEVEDEEEEEEEVQPQRRPQRRSIIESIDPSSLIIENDPNAKLHRFMQVGDSKSFVCRSNALDSGVHWKTRESGGAFDLHVYGNDSGNKSNISQDAIIKSDKFAYKKDALAPSKALLHGGESKMLFVDEKDKEAVYYMDLEREKVVAKYDTNELKADVMWSSFKGAAASSDPTFLCANNKAFFMMDTRQAAGTNRNCTLQYATNPQFTAAASDAHGHIVLGNKFGQLRLYDGQPNQENKFKIAKTQLDSKQEVIKAVDVSDDGSWILGTMKSTLVLFPAKLKSTGRTGFETRLGKNKPPALYLRLRNEDIMKYGLEEIDLQAAVFDAENRSILTSTGNLAIIWDFKAIKKGKLDSYKLKIMPEYIKDCKAMNDGSVVVAYPTDLGRVTTKATRLSHA